MANQVAAVGVRKASFIKAGSTAAVGDLLRYTAPANKRAACTCARTSGINAAVQLILYYSDGTNMMQMIGNAAGANLAQITEAGIQMNPGDATFIRVDTAVVATTADGYLGIVEEA